MILLVLAFPLPGNTEALLDLRKLVPGAQGLVIWLLSLALMSAGWIGAMRVTRNRTFSDVRIPLLVITSLVYVGLMFVYPGTAIDVYIYAARSHLLTDYGLNPSIALPEMLWDIDPYVHYASQEWSTRPSPYGPLWNIIASPGTAFDQERIGVAVAIYKGLMALGSAATGVLIYQIARRVQPTLAVPALIGWLWSPVVLWEGLANAHNDILLALLIVAAFWCWYRGYLGGVLPLLGAAALLKVVAVLAIPAAIVAIYRRAGWSRELGRVAVQTAVFSIAALWIAFAPFFDIASTIDAIRTQSTVMVTSPAVLVQNLSGHFDWGWDVRAVFPSISNPIIAAITIVGAIAAWRKPALLPLIAFEQLFWFLLLATSNLRPWYAIWLLALAVVLPLGTPFARTAAWIMGTLAAYGWLLWGQRWFELERLALNGIALGIMFLPTLAITFWAYGRAWRTRKKSNAPATQ